MKGLPGERTGTIEDCFSAGEEQPKEGGNFKGGCFSGLTKGGCSSGLPETSSIGREATGRVSTGEGSSGIGTEEAREAPALPPRPKEAPWVSCM